MTCYVGTLYMTPPNKGHYSNNLSFLERFCLPSLAKGDYTILRLPLSGLYHSDKASEIGTTCLYKGDTLSTTPCYCSSVLFNL